MVKKWCYGAERILFSKKIILWNTFWQLWLWVFSQEETNALNKTLKSNEQPTTAPDSVGTLEEPKEGCNLSHQIDTTVRPKYRLLLHSLTSLLLTSYSFWLSVILWTLVCTHSTSHCPLLMLNKKAFNYMWFLFRFLGLSLFFHFSISPAQDMIVT